MKRWISFILAITMILRIVPIITCYAENKVDYVKEEYYEFDNSQEEEHGIVYVSNSILLGSAITSTKAKLKLRLCAIQPINILHNGELITRNSPIEVALGESLYISPMVEAGIEQISYAWDYVGYFKPIHAKGVVKMDIPQEVGEHILSLDAWDEKGKTYQPYYYINVIDKEMETTKEQIAKMEEPLSGYTEFVLGEPVPKNYKIVVYVEEEELKDIGGFIYTWDRTDVYNRDSSLKVIGIGQYGEIEIPENFEIGTEHKLYIEAWQKRDVYHWTQLYTIIVGKPA